MSNTKKSPETPWQAFTEAAKLPQVTINKNGYEIRTEIGRAHVNSSHTVISYAVFCLKKKKKKQ